MTWWWSWLLTAVGVTGLWLAGSRRSLGWMIGLWAQALWVFYALATKQYGFLASAAAYGTVYFRNLRRWWWCEARPAESPWRGQCLLRNGHRDLHVNASGDRWDDEPKKDVR